MLDVLLFGLVTAAVSVPPATGPGPDDTVSGTFVIDGDTVRLTYVIARRVHPMMEKDKVVTQLLLTAQPVPEEALDDPFALQQAVREGRVTGVQLEYEEGERSVTAELLSSRLTGTLSVSRSGSSVGPVQRTADRIAGSWEATTTSMNDQKVVVSVQWSARVQPLPVVVEPTPADAAAALAHPAVKAWQAIERAIHAGDKAALLQVAPPSTKAMASQPDFDDGFKMMKTMTPKVSRYLRVTEKHGKVIIEAEAKGLMDGVMKRGTITMMREAGVWWVDTMTF